MALSRKQERFLQKLLIGETVVDAAKGAGISRTTAYRWLDDMAFAAERVKREQALAEAEQAAIDRIMTSGYALVHQRVEALNELAALLKEEVFDPKKRWLPDVKAVGFERVDLVQFNADLIKEFRATFADLASELGQRVKKQEIEHSGLKDLLDSEHAALLAELAALPDDAAQSEKPDSGTGTDSTSSSP